MISLGSTQIIDGIAEALSAEVGGAAKVVALVLDIFVAGLFVLFGYLAGQKYLWAYAIGMVVFLIDGLLALAFQDWIGVIAHGFVLFWLFRGFHGRSRSRGAWKRPWPKARLKPNPLCS